MPGTGAEGPIFHIGGLNLQPRRRRRRPQSLHQQGRRPTSIDPQEGTRRIARDGGSPICVQEVGLPHARYRYDESGQLIERVDARGHVTRYAYDEAGRLIQVMHPDGAALRLTYDAEGRLFQRVLPNGDTCTFDTVAGRLEGITFSAGDAIRLTYDRFGRLTTVTEPGCVTTYGGAAPGRLPRLERVIDQAPFAYDYNAQGQLIRLTLANQATIDLHLLAASPPDPVVPSEPQRDAHANVIAYDGSQWRYDDHDRLIEAQQPGYGQTRYQYDPAGNRTVRHGSDGVTRYTYDNRNRLTCVIHPDGSITDLAYDANGNLLRKAHGPTTWRYAYNGRQQLASIQRNGQVVARYRYDFQGRRIWRQVGETITLYHYDEANRLVALTRPEGSPIVVFTEDQGHTAAHCFENPDSVQTYFLHTDYLDSTRQITDSAGQVIWRGEYTPFGRLRGEPPPFDCPLFAGQLWDTESGFYYCQSRYYDPQVGRFISPDPWTHGPDDARLLGQSGAAQPVPADWPSQPRLAHPYVYCLNNPLTHRDPTGLSVGWTILRTILAIFWSSPWTIFGFALALVDALLQFALLGALYLPSFGLDRTASGRIGSAALLKIGGFANFQFAWANVIFAQRGDFDGLDDTQQQYIIPVEAQRTPRQLRTEKRAYLDYLLRHTVLANYFGPIWPPVYLFGGFIPFRKNAVRESGFSPIDDPALTVAPDKVYSRADSHLIAIGGKKPYAAQVSNTSVGTITPFVDQSTFSEARFQPQYLPGEYTMTLRDANNASDTREVEIVRLKVDDIEATRPAALFVDDISDPKRPTVRLVDREQGTVEIDVDPNEGQLFFEAPDQDPNNALQSALILPHTGGMGNTQVAIQPRSVPPGLQRILPTNASLHTDLNAQNTNAVQQAFQAVGIVLGANFRIGVGITTFVTHRWEIDTGTEQYRVQWPLFTVYDANDRFITVLNPALVANDLMRNNLTNAVIDQFRDNLLPFPINSKGVQLAVNATLVNLQPNTRWEITSGAETYTIEADDRLYIIDQRGVAAVNYKVHVRPWDNQVLFTFPFNAAHQSSLDGGNSSPAIRQQFQIHGATLSGSETVLVLNGGSEWQLTDGDQGFTLRRNGNNMEVRPGLKVLQVRSMARITVIIQPHVIRESDGSNAAWSLQDINTEFQKANDIWRQAGIHFHMRNTHFIDNTALQRIRVVESTRQFNGRFTWFDSDDLDLMVAWDRAHAPTPATDPRAIHVYFFESLDFQDNNPNDNTEVKAFAGGGIGGNWLAVPRGIPEGALAHELGHCLALSHPDQENNPNLRGATQRIMFSNASSFSRPHLVANQDPTRPNLRHDETLLARQIAATRTGP